MAETAGTLLAHRYRLVEQLGRGGMGVVWLARDEAFGRDVAIKEVLLPPQLAEKERETVFQRTRREARVAARLSHPNVVKVYDVVEYDNRPWIVMELVRARSLTEVVEESGPLTPQRVAAIGLQVLSALSAAHAAGITHRDVKPGNVLCSDNGRVVLTDFGIASVADDPSVTMHGVLMGSPAYIAPERVRGGPARAASDLWSLAATLYAAVEGRPPYDRGSAVPTVTAVVNEDPDPLQRAGLLGPVLDKIFVKDPDERPNAEAIRAMLREVASTPDGDAAATVIIATPDPAPAKPDEPAEPAAVAPARRRNAAMALAAVTVGALVIGGSLLQNMASQAENRPSASGTDNSSSSPSASTSPSESPSPSASLSPSASPSPSFTDERDERPRRPVPVNNRPKTPSPTPTRSKPPTKPPTPPPSPSSSPSPSASPTASPDPTGPPPPEGGSPSVTPGN